MRYTASFQTIETKGKQFEVQLFIEPETLQAYPHPEGMQKWVGYKAYAKVDDALVGDKYQPIGVGYQVQDKPEFPEVVHHLAHAAVTKAILRRLVEVPAPLPMGACDSPKPYSGEYPAGFPAFG